MGQVSFLAPLAILFLVPILDAQTYVLSVEDAVMVDGVPTQTRVLLDHEEVISGWSFGVCHDSAALELICMNCNTLVNFSDW